MFQAFFEKYEARLLLRHGSKARNQSTQTAVVQAASAYSLQLQTCKA
jgi:hypothetical protein